MSNNLSANKVLTDFLTHYSSITKHQDSIIHQFGKYLYQPLVGDASQQKCFYRVNSRNLHLSTSPDQPANRLKSMILVVFNQDDPPLESEEIYVINRLPKDLTAGKLYLEISHWLQNNLPNTVSVWGDKRLNQLSVQQPSKQLVLIQDLGQTNLHMLLRQKSDQNEILVGNCYEELIHWIAKLQAAGKKLPHDHLLKKRIFEAQAMKSEISELINFCQQNLNLSNQVDHLHQQLNQLCEQIVQSPLGLALIHRDFQSKNIMFYQLRPYVIDVQDLCLGPACYDLASLLYDPNAELSCLERQRLAKIHWEHYWKIRIPSYPVFLRLVRLTAIQRVLKSIGRHAQIYLERNQRPASRTTVLAGIRIIRSLLNQELREEAELDFRSPLNCLINQIEQYFDQQ